MKTFTAMRRLRARSHRLRFPLALLYLWLGVAAAWHAPHAAATESLLEQSAAAAPSLNADAFCALCSWQSLQQRDAPAPGAAESVGAAADLVEAAVPSPAPAFFPAPLARGPPSA